MGDLARRAEILRIVVILPVMLLALVLTEAQDKTTEAAKPNDADEKMLIVNERALHAAVAKADMNSFLSLVLPEGVWTTKQGFVPMELFAKGGLEVFELTKWDIVNPHVIWLGQDAALVRYAWTGTGTFGHQPLAPMSLASTVWTKRNGKWLAVHHQQTELVR